MIGYCAKLEYWGIHSDEAVYWSRLNKRELAPNNSAATRGMKIDRLPLLSHVHEIRCYIFIGIVIYLSDWCFTNRGIQICADVLHNLT